MKMRTLIVIPTVPENRDQLSKCINSIIKNTNIPYEIYISMNNWEGFPIAVNRGLKKALENKDISGILILNDDTMVTNGWLQFMKIKADLREDIGLIGLNNQPNFWGTVRKDHIAFWCVYIKREVIEKIGLLDERYIYGEWEDIDYSVRSLEAGYTISGVDVIIYHNTSSTLRRLNKEQLEEKAKNKDRFKEKWKGTKWEWWFD